MSLTVQSIANDVSLDVRQAVLSTGSDLTILTGFIDRIHKDCLHSSVYSYLNLQTDSVTTTPGQSTYTLTQNLIRRVISVYDRTRDRVLFPLERATSPVSQVERQEINPGSRGSAGSQYGANTGEIISALSLQSGQPEYWRHRGPVFGSPPGTKDTIILFPTPKQALTLEISEEVQVTTLVNPTDVLVVPEDGRDMVVAGVDYLTNIYLKRAEEAQAWNQLYQQLKTGVSLS